VELKYKAGLLISGIIVICFFAFFFYIFFDSFEGCNSAQGSVTRSFNPEYDGYCKRLRYYLYASFGGMVLGLTISIFSALSNEEWFRY
jgi:hypothetical protein